MGVCLLSLILSTGLGSLSSGRWPLNSGTRIVTLEPASLAATLIATQAVLTASVRGHYLTALCPCALRLPWRSSCQLAFSWVSHSHGHDTGQPCVIAEPTPWFWGINGATGVLASVVAVMVSMAFGINVTMLLAGICYLCSSPLPERCSDCRTCQQQPRDGTQLLWACDLLGMSHRSADRAFSVVRAS